MKIFVVYLSLITISIMVGCGLVASQSKIEKIDEQVADFRNTGDQDVLLFPDGTTFTHLGTQISFMLPQGYVLEYVTVDRSVGSGTTGTITCDCTSADGTCTPYETNKKVGCSTDKDDLCKTCKMTTIASFNGEEAELHEYFIAINTESNAPEVETEVMFVNSISTWVSLEWVKKSDISEFSEDIDEVINYFSEFNGTKVSVAISINNRKAYLSVPYDALESGMMYSINSDVMTTSGSCSGCSGDCTFETAKLGQIRHCVGCNSGCSLSW